MLTKVHMFILFIHTHIHIHIHIHIRIRIRIRIRIHIYVHTQTQTHAHTYAYTIIYLYILNTNTYVHTYTHPHIRTEVYTRYREKTNIDHRSNLVRFMHILYIYIYPPSCCRAGHLACRHVCRCLGDEAGTRSKGSWRQEGPPG